MVTWRKSHLLLPILWLYNILTCSNTWKKKRCKDLFSTCTYTTWITVPRRSKTQDFRCSYKKGNKIHCYFHHKTFSKGIQQKQFCCLFFQKNQNLFVYLSLLEMNELSVDLVPQKNDLTCHSKLAMELGGFGHVQCKIL